MKSIALTFALLIGFACSSYAHTLSEKISGNWNLPQPDPDKKISLSFGKDGSGIIKITRRAGKRICNVSVEFTCEAATESGIRFCSGGSTAKGLAKEFLTRVKCMG